MINNNELNKFRSVNRVATPGGIAFVGSDFFAQLPFFELAQAFRIDEKIYNRSLKGATVASVCENIEEFILGLCPSKVFLNLGDIEASEGMDANEFIESFEWLLCSIQNRCAADIYVVSISAKSELHEKYDIALKKLCSDCGCRFIDATPSFNGLKPEIDVFKALKLYLHDKLDFTEMMIML